ncbi:MAG: hypothetical protein QM770_23310 [Tepidisphaeraceae bacterium]
MAIRVVPRERMERLFFEPLEPRRLADASKASDALSIDPASYASLASGRPVQELATPIVLPGQPTTRLSVSGNIGLREDQWWSFSVVGSSGHRVPVGIEVRESGYHMGFDVQGWSVFVRLPNDVYPPIGMDFDTRGTGAALATNETITIPYRGRMISYAQSDIPGMLARRHVVADIESDGVPEAIDFTFDGVTDFNSPDLPLIDATDVDGRPEARLVHVRVSDQALVGTFDDNRERTLVTTPLPSAEGSVSLLAIVSGSMPATARTYAVARIGLAIQTDVMGISDDTMID